MEQEQHTVNIYDADIVELLKNDGLELQDPVPTYSLPAIASVKVDTFALEYNSNDGIWCRKVYIKSTGKWYNLK